MVGTGLLVLGVQMDLALRPGGSEFWLFLGPAILGSLVLFSGFYVAALLKRRRPQEHKRLIVLASTGGLGAATFRIVGPVFAFSPSSQIAGVLLPNLFLVAAMLLERGTRRGVHHIYRVGLPVSVMVTVLLLVLTPTPAGTALMRAMARVGRVLTPLY